MEIRTEVPQKTKNRTTTWSSNSTPGYLFQENENIKSKSYMHSNVHIALFTIAKIWKQPEHPATDEHIKMWYIYGILLSPKERI